MHRGRNSAHLADTALPGAPLAARGVSADSSPVRTASLSRPAARAMAEREGVPDASIARSGDSIRREVRTDGSALAEPRDGGPLAVRDAMALPRIDGTRETTRLGVKERNESSRSSLANRLRCGVRPDGGSLGAPSAAL